MAGVTSVDLARRVGGDLEQSSPDLLRMMVQTFAEALMSAEADAACGAPYGQSSGERVNRRNGYRQRRWDTQAGSIELAIPKLRQGSYFPDWLLERRRRSEQALISVAAIGVIQEFQRVWTAYEGKISTGHLGGRSSRPTGR